MHLKTSEYSDLTPYSTRSGSDMAMYQYDYTSTRYVRSIVLEGKGTP